MLKDYPSEMRDFIEFFAGSFRQRIVEGSAPECEVEFRIDGTGVRSL